MESTKLDGSSMYAIQALWTAVRLKLTLIVIVLKNRRYAALEKFAQRFGFRENLKLVGTDIDGLDFVALAHGLGREGIWVGHIERLVPVISKALLLSQPILIEVEIE
jgi:benzoylformate decarboxylase